MTNETQQARRAAFERIYPRDGRKLDDDGLYSGEWASFYNAKWEAFNAALDSIVIELPDAVTGESLTACAQRIAVREVVNAIHAAGVKTR